MKAVRLYAAGDLRFEEIQRPPKPGADEVRLRVTAAGICGSDLHNYRTGQWISRTPSVAGHEFSGVIDAVGQNIPSELIGTKVVADSRYWCGECDNCRMGFQHICSNLGFVGEIIDGGFAEEIVLPHRLVHEVNSRVPSHIAAMAEPLAVALHALNRLQLPSKAPLLIVGCGTIGGFAALLASRLHDGPILVADLNADRANLAASVCKARIVEMSADVLRRASDGMAVRFALDATGSLQVISQLPELIDGGGSIALVGISHGTFPLDPNVLVEREISLEGCHAFKDELPQVIKMLPDLQDDLEKLIDEVIELADVPNAYERLLAGKCQGLKTIIQIDR
ncbi:MAG: zinc-binding dehydrogenase [Hyphomicrobiales bacterium]